MFQLFNPKALDDRSASACKLCRHQRVSIKVVEHFDTRRYRRYGRLSTYIPAKAQIDGRVNCCWKAFYRNPSKCVAAKGLSATTGVCSSGWTLPGKRGPPRMSERTHECPLALPRKFPRLSAPFTWVPVVLLRHPESVSLRNPSLHLFNRFRIGRADDVCIRARCPLF
jgi:hypothetical protein